MPGVCAGATVSTKAATPRSSSSTTPEVQQCVCAHTHTHTPGSPIQLTSHSDPPKSAQPARARIPPPPSQRTRHVRHGRKNGPKSVHARRCIVNVSARWGPRARTVPTPAEHAPERSGAADAHEHALAAGHAGTAEQHDGGARAAEGARAGA
jgi:hypothetical protein